MQSLTEYMKKELVFYIKQERDKGVPLTQIKKSLLEGGHHTNLIKEAMRSLKKNNYNLVKALNEPIKSSLDKELYFNIMNSLIKYVEYQLAAGKTEKEIRKILEDYGHTNDVIEKAVKGMKDEKPKKTRSFLKYFDTGMIVFVFIGVLLVSGFAKEPLEFVIFGFSPTIFTIIALNISFDRKKVKEFLWIIPVFFSLAFTAIGLSGITGLNLEYLRLTIVNLAFSLLYTYLKSAQLFNVEKYENMLQQSVSTDSDKEIDKKREEHKPKKENHKKK